MFLAFKFTEFGLGLWLGLKHRICKKATLDKNAKNDGAPRVSLPYMESIGYRFNVRVWPCGNFECIPCESETLAAINNYLSPTTDLLLLPVLVGQRTFELGLLLDCWFDFVSCRIVPYLSAHCARRCKTTADCEVAVKRRSKGHARR